MRENCYFMFLTLTYNRNIQVSKVYNLEYIKIKKSLENSIIFLITHTQQFDYLSGQMVPFGM